MLEWRFLSLQSCLRSLMLQKQSAKGSLGKKYLGSVLWYGYGSCRQQSPRGHYDSQLLRALWLKPDSGTRRTDVTISWAWGLSSSPNTGDLVQHSVIFSPVTVQNNIPPQLSHTESKCSANANQVSINSLKFHQCGPCFYSSGSVKHLNEYIVLKCSLN